MSYTCTKRYQDIPIAHRLPKHTGHCAKIHGHNIAFEVTFAAKYSDTNNFVVDFGDLKEIKDFIAAKLDHCFLVDVSDPLHEDISRLNGGTNITLVHSASTEGIAYYIFEEIRGIINAKTDYRVTVASVTVWEDSKNSATYSEKPDRTYGSN